MPSRPDNPIRIPVVTSGPEKPVGNVSGLKQEGTSSAGSNITKIKPEHPLGYIRPARRRPNQDPSVPGATPTENQPETREKKPKAVPIFTKIPLELEDVFMTMMFTLGHKTGDAHYIRKGKDPVRIPGAQSRRRQLRWIVDEIDTSRENPSKIITLYYIAVSELHPSTDPDMRHEQPPLTQKQIDLILQDPVGIIAADILQTAQHTKILIPPMNSKVVDRLTMLRDDFEVAKTGYDPQALVVKPKETQKTTDVLSIPDISTTVTNIRDAILVYLLYSRTDFRDEYKRIGQKAFNKEIAPRMNRSISRILGDKSIPVEQIPMTIVDAVIADLSVRRSLRQGFFDKFPKDDGAVTGPTEETPGIQASGEKKETLGDLKKQMALSFELFLPK